MSHDQTGPDAGLPTMSPTRRSMLSMAVAGAMAPVLAGAAQRNAKQEAAPGAYEAIIIGAGFAGLTAARELTQLGHKVLILEARDRVGGRTHTEQFAGHAADLGGTWVHWAQGNIWAEISRYGIELEESPAYAADDTIFLDYEGRRHEGKGSELGAELYMAMQRLMANARTDVPRPAEPFVDNKWVTLDTSSVGEKLADPELSPNGKIMADSFFSVVGATAPENISWIEMERLYALCGYDLALTGDVLGRFMIKGGMQALYNAIAADCGATIEFGAQVKSVATTEAGVTISTISGRSYSAPAAISTLPLNILADVAFDPPLPPQKLKVSRQQHGGKCTKIHILVDRAYPMFSAAAPGKSPVRQLVWEGVKDGHTHLIAFGANDKDLLNPDRRALQAAVRQFLPEASIVDVKAHDWNSDPYAKGVWCSARPGQISPVLRELQSPHGRIFFASSDWATVWRGFIDGAIEQGVVNARSVHALLGKTQA